MLNVYDWICAVLFAIPVIAVAMTVIFAVTVVCWPFALFWLLRRAIFADDVGLTDWVCDNLMNKLWKTR